MLAELDGELIFESEVLPEVDRRLAEEAPEISLEEKFRRRPAYVQQELARVIDRKLLCQAARREAPEIAQAAFEAAAGDETSVATAWLRGHTQAEETVTYDQMLAYYRTIWRNISYPRPYATSR